jgi:hypothetical protein
LAGAILNGALRERTVKHGRSVLKILPIAAGVLLPVALYAGWTMNEACSTYRGTFRPADMACDMAKGRELEITVGKRLPPPGTSGEQAGKADKRSICRTSNDRSWQLACDLPFGRELFVDLSPNRQPRVRCKLFFDCPAHY